MILHTQQPIDQQEALIVIAGKKTAEIPELPVVVAEEFKRFIDEKSDFHTLSLLGKQYVFVGEQKTDEAYRVAGFKARSFILKTAATVCIHGHKSTSYLLAEGLLLSNYQFLKYRKEATKEK